MIRPVYRRWLSDALAPEVQQPEDVSSEATDAVLAFAVGVGLNDVALFVRSLRSVYAGRIVMVVGRNLTLRAYLRTHGVELESVGRRKWRWRPHGSIERFAAFVRILDERSDLGNVVLTEVKAVRFRADPFESPMPPLKFYADPAGQTIAERRGRLKALGRLAGPQVARKLRRKIDITPIRIAGSRPVVAQFCRSLLLMCAYPWSARGAGRGADRAAINLIAHYDVGQPVAIGRLGLLRKGE